MEVEEREGEKVKEELEEEGEEEEKEGKGNKRAKDGGDIEMEDGGDGRRARGKEREASFDGPRVPGLPRDLTLTESQK